MRHLVKVFDSAGGPGKLALNDVSLEIASGELFVLMGLSGSGKSTLVRHLNRLIEPTRGEVWIDGRNILQLDAAGLRKLRRQQISMVFQGFALLPHRDVLGNVAYGLELRGESASSAAATASEWITKVGLAGCEHQYPDQLSGGMKQRVGLARALACNTDILLMDEAFSALDPLIRRDMQDQLLQLQSSLHKTIVFVTHDLDEALRLGDRIAILQQGKVLQVGPPQEILRQPADEHVRRFVGGRGG